MKGLLLKDLYMTAKYCRAYFLMIACFLGAAVFGGGQLLFIAYPCLLCGLLPMTLYIYDEKEKWCSYSMTLSVSRTQYVTAKYVFGFGCALLAIVLAAAAYAVWCASHGGLAAERYLPIFFLLVGLGLLPSAVLMPFMFRFGADKGRIIYFVTVGAICACGVVMSDRLGGGIPQVTGAATAAAAVLLYLLSWRLSILFFRKREL